MATVNLRLRGGPSNGERAVLHVDDPNNPPEVFTTRVHGPHETDQRCEYRRIGQEPEDGTWIYESTWEPQR